MAVGFALHTKQVGYGKLLKKPQADPNNRGRKQRSHAPPSKAEGETPQLGHHPSCQASPRRTEIDTERRWNRREGLFSMKVLIVLLMSLFINLDCRNIMCTIYKFCVYSVFPLPVRRF